MTLDQRADDRPGIEEMRQLYGAAFDRLTLHAEAGALVDIVVEVKEALTEEEMYEMQDLVFGAVRLLELLGQCAGVVLHTRSVTFKMQLIDEEEQAW